MKKLFFVSVFLTCFVSLYAAASWDCSSDTDCPEGTTCNSNSSVCVMTKEKVAEYAAVTLSFGENNPSLRGADRIFVKNPANDLVLGQLAVNAYAGGGDGQFYFIKELTTDISVYPSSIKFENFKLIHDANGNGTADSSEKVVAEGVAEGFGIKFELHQKDQGFKMNQVENFLIVGSFSSEKEITDLSKFNATVKNNYIVTKTYKGDGNIAETAPIVFPSFSFEPEKGYFLLSAGKHFPSAPTWKEINREQEIMHLRLKALDGANELLTLKVELSNQTVSFGNGVKKISLCTDPDNDGKCNETLSELSGFETPQQAVLLQIPSGKVQLDEGEETFLVVKADLDFYKDQNTSFYINDSDVTLKTRQKIAGTPVKTENFKYSCKEDDPECRLKPEEETDEKEEDGDSGCSLLFVD